MIQTFSAFLEGFDEVQWSKVSITLFQHQDTPKSRPHTPIPDSNMFVSQQPGTHPGKLVGFPVSSASAALGRRLGDPGIRLINAIHDLHLHLPSAFGWGWFWGEK